LKLLEILLKMKFEVTTKTIVTKRYIVEADNEKEAVDKTTEPVSVYEDDEEVVWTEEIKENERN
jgi:hypothetical protein